MNVIDKPILYIIIPCYNEEAVLPLTAPQFLEELYVLINKKKVSDKSRIMFVNDGSSDNTWGVISDLAKNDWHYTGISQSCNRGHQSSLLAGLHEAIAYADITISIDCDGQDDITAMEKMVDEYHNGNDIVYGVRSDRKTDTFFKRYTAELFYKLLSVMGAEVVFNHADYRLVSKRVLEELTKYSEVNLFLRGMFPLIGFRSTKVYYERHERLAGNSHYPLSKMLLLATNGITNLSVKPLRMIIGLGLFIAFFAFIGAMWGVLAGMTGQTVDGWASTICIVCFIGGIQLICTGILGEYIGKIYMEVKHRPRFVISERTEE